MGLFDELLLPLTTVLFAVLIAAIASAAAGLGRARSSGGDRRSVELEELGKGRERSEILESEGAKEELDDCCLEIEKTEKRSEFLDPTIQDSEKESEGEGSSKAADLLIEVESAKELGGPVRIGEGDGEMVPEREQLAIDEGGGGGGVENRVDQKVGSLLWGEDEWEGIERSGPEKLFAVAMEYVGSKDGSRALSKLSSDVQKQLYGLHKVATEGPCYEPQPLALKVSARAKWHSWQRLGNMNPEVAMEQYISLLSENIPGWMGKQPEDKGDNSPDVGASRTEVPDESSFLDSRPISSGIQRISKESFYVDVDKPTTSLNLSEKGLNLTFLFSLLSPTRAAFLTCYC